MRSQGRGEAACRLSQSLLGGRAEISRSDLVTLTTVISVSMEDLAEINNLAGLFQNIVKDCKVSQTQEFSLFFID